ncbi:N-acetylmuramoyl-L-alanine amidase [Hoeflea sp. YIM 152468]|uniref:N-acetylmuramoyl-L-alanine amidase n=1 Tax=Hoeflea sp. YIM 152468 TaxID=3031759 RepID=UPI0023DADF6B|nr:N-acetylmuramoyl-L-alanine amidase [Hoeflea sp. YIM 152468]MDF1607059.1 N-acetylmuramoyl-L-alanine amidase [Hoeflea sp. YIM 152468]
MRALCALTLVMTLPVNVLAEPEAATETRYVAIGARMAGDENRVRLVIDFERAPKFSLRYLENPYRAVIDLPETVFAFPEGSLAPRGLVSAVRYGNSGKGRARLVFEFTSPARMELAESSKEASGVIHRTVFDIMRVDRAAFLDEVARTEWADPDQKTARTRATDRARDTLTIVIDAGHGGIDGGAEGAAGSMEKDITLAFAQDLKSALEAQSGFRVEMTRTDDSFLSLSARVRRAREVDADLLISLHADSISLKSLRGATVYTLSDKASDAVAQSLADQENGEDAIVGASLDNAPEAIAAILVDLARTETRVFSTGLAQQVISSFEGQVKLINNPLRHAGFRVLQAPDVPSVLVEMGYLSNREDEKLLNDEEWRENTARLLAQSVEKYRATILAGRQ